MGATRTKALLGAGVVAIAAIVLAACGGGTGYGGSSNPSPAVTTGGAAAATPTQAATASVNAAGGAANVIKMVEGQGDPTTAWKFEPAQITVKVGDTVSFQNSGTQQHTATADDKSFDTGAIDVGATKEVTFSKAGTFAFHCSFHTWMKGTVTVTASGTTAGAAGISPSSASSSSAPKAMPSVGGGASGYGY